MEDKVNTGSAAVNAESNSTPAKKASKSKIKSNQQKKSQPPTSEMVTAAIKDLKDRKGSSLQAIKKYIVANYKMDAEKVAPFIKRYLKTAVTSGAVVQTKGKGASGSFKLPKPAGKVQRTPKAETRKTTIEKKIAAARKAAVAKKPATAKKAAAGSPKKPAQRKATKPAEKSKAAAETKSPSRAKKTVKAPAAKTKTPKPKKATAAKAVKSTGKK
ncbi:histone H1B-like [Linepithema humile]|uniref:histone H1B-like n=1 Tax=Linepithema humile TaxID=83485 RepID=UPI0006239966|nr:PREDICTED: histone H1B-like [Linepithema humile]